MNKITKYEIVKRYGILKAEIRRRGLEFSPNVLLDKALFKRAMTGIDVEGLDDVIIEDYVSISGPFVKSCREAKVVDLVIKDDEENRDGELEEQISKAVQSETKKECRFTYNKAGPTPPYIPLFDKVIRAKRETSKVEAGKTSAIVSKPYPNEHSCRLQDPKKYDTCRRGERVAHKPKSVDGKKYYVIYCKKGNGPMEQQALRYPKDKWTLEQAKGHCKLNEGTFEPATEKVEKEEQFEEVVEKFAGSPRNPFGTHCSFRFEGGAAGYKKAWMVHFSQINGGALTPRASGPIRGTVRRVAMIAKVMKPTCDIRESEGMGARPGPKSPLPGSYPQRPSDYGLSSWLSPSDEGVDREKALRFTCSDLNVIKKAAVAEVKRRIKDREAEEESKKMDEEEGAEKGQAVKLEFGKIDKKEHIVGGIIYEPDKKDTQGDEANAKEIWKALKSYMVKKKSIKVMHKGKAKSVPIVECFQAEEDTHKGGTGPEHLVKKGAWWLSIYLGNEPEIWKDVLSGKLNGFSMAGRASAST